MANMEDITRSLETILRDTACAVLTLDEAGTVVSHNPVACQLFRCDAQALNGRPFDALFAPWQEPAPGEASLFAGLDKSGEVSLALAGLRGDQTAFAANVLLTSVNQDGRAPFLCVAHDLDPLLTRLAVEQGSENYYRLLFDHAPVGLLAVDPQGTVIQANRALLRWFPSLPAEPASGPASLRDSGLASMPGFHDALRESVNAAEATVHETEVPAPDGPPRPVRIRTVPVRNEAGGVEVLLCTFEERLPDRRDTPAHGDGSGPMVGPAAVRGPGAAGEAAPVEPGHAGRSRRVLVAEDNPVSQKLMSALLADLGYPCTLVANGRAAVEAVQRATFDLVLMDLQMPLMDGLSATQEIRRHLAGGALPIIGMTADSLSTDRERCLAAGMDDAIAKPIEPDTLKRLLSAWLEPRDAAQTDAGDTPLAEWEQLAALDFAHLDAVQAYAQGREPAGFAAVAALFARELRQTLAGLEAARDVQRWDALESGAEQLRQLCGGFGAPRLQALASELLTHVQARSRVLVNELFPHLAGAARQAIRELERRYGVPCEDAPGKAGPAGGGEGPSAG